MPLKTLVERFLPMSHDGSDVVVYRIIVTFLGLGLLTCLASLTLLTWAQREPPPTFGTLAGAIVGSFATMLMPTPRGPGHQPPAPQGQGPGGGIVQVGR